MNPFDPRSLESRIVIRIEGGFGANEAGEFDKAQDELDRNHGASRYDTLHNAFGARDNDTDPFEGWDGANLEEFLRCVIGPARDFTEDYDAMSDEEKGEAFPDLNVAIIVDLWAQRGRMDLD